MIARYWLVGFALALAASSAFAGLWTRAQASAQVSSGQIYRDEPPGDSDSCGYCPLVTSDKSASISAATGSGSAVASASASHGVLRASC